MYFKTDVVSWQLSGDHMPVSIRTQSEGRKLFMSIA